MPANNVCCPSDEDSKRLVTVPVRLTTEEAADLDHLRYRVRLDAKPHSRSCYLRQSFHHRCAFLRMMSVSHTHLRTLLPFEPALSCAQSSVDRIHDFLTQAGEDFINAPLWKAVLINA